MFFLLFTLIGNAQIGISTVKPNASSILDITRMLAPRMTTAQRTTIVTPADALLVYDTDLKSFYYYNSTTASPAIPSGGILQDKTSNV